MASNGVIGQVSIGDNIYSLSSTSLFICSSSASSDTKTATLDNGSSANFNLISGITIHVLFANGNTSTSPTLNVNNTGAKRIYKFNKNFTELNLESGTIITLTYFDDNSNTDGWWINGEKLVSPISDVTVNGNSIVSSRVANLVTNTAYNSSSNKIATMSDISNKFYTINISYSSSALEYISDKLFADISDAYSNGEILRVSYSPDESNNHYQLIGVEFDSHDLPTDFIFGLIVDKQTDNYTCLVDYFYITDSDKVYRNSIELSEEDHVHGNMASNGSISDNVEISSGDRLIISDKSNSSKLVCSSITFGTSDNTFLANDGTWRGVSGASGGTVTEVNTGTDLIGGPITGSGTISHATSGVIAKTTRGLYPFKVNSTGHITDVGNAVTVPTKVSDLTNDLGFTSNTGTITGITMNGSSKGTSGVVNLGTVLTEIPTADQIVYQPEDQTWSVSDVDEALNDLKIYSDSSITDIKVNSSSQTISNKSVNITVPTKVSDLTNDSGYITDAGVTSFNGSTGAITYTAPVTSVNGSTGAVTISVPTKVSDLTNDSGFTSNTGTVTSITAGTGLTGGTITSSGTIALGTSGVTAGTYQGLTVDKYGRVTSASNQNYLTSESDPTVPAWAKASTKPTYTASEVGALSSTLPINIDDSLYLRGTGLWRSTTTTNADRIITTVNSGKDLMINADSTKTDANTGTIFLGYTNTTAVNIGTSSSDVALNYNGSAAFSNSYTSPSVYSSRCTVTNGGYMQIGKWVIVNLYITIDATLNANTNSLLIYDLPEPGFSMSLSASATAPGTVKGLNSFIRKHTTSGATKGEICICSTSGLASGNVVLISGIYTVS